MVRFLPLSLLVLVAAIACRRDSAGPAEPPPTRRASRSVPTGPTASSSRADRREESRRGEGVQADFDATIREYEEKLQAHRSRIAGLLRDQGDLTVRMSQALGRAEERVMELEAQLDVAETTYVERILRGTNY
jgi:plasmid maintenance system antidote protein VapI